MTQHDRDSIRDSMKEQVLVRVSRHKKKNLRNGIMTEYKSTKVKDFESRLSRLRSRLLNFGSLVQSPRGQYQVQSRGRILKPVLRKGNTKKNRCHSELRVSFSSASPIPFDPDSPSSSEREAWEQIEAGFLLGNSKSAQIQPVDTVGSQRQWSPIQVKFNLAEICACKSNQERINSDPALVSKLSDTRGPAISVVQMPQLTEEHGDDLLGKPKRNLAMRNKTNQDNSQVDAAKQTSQSPLKVCGDVPAPLRPVLTSNRDLTAHSLRYPVTAAAVGATKRRSSQVPHVAKSLDPALCNARLFTPFQVWRERVHGGQAVGHGALHSTDRPVVEARSGSLISWDSGSICEGHTSGVAATPVVHSSAPRPAGFDLRTLYDVLSGTVVSSRFSISLPAAEAEKLHRTVHCLDACSGCRSVDLPGGDCRLCPAAGPVSGPAAGPVPRTESPPSPSTPTPVEPVSGPGGGQPRKQCCEERLQHPIRQALSRQPDRSVDPLILSGGRLARTKDPLFRENPVAVSSNRTFCGGGGGGGGCGGAPLAQALALLQRDPRLSRLCDAFYGDLLSPTAEDGTGRGAAASVGDVQRF